MTHEKKEAITVLSENLARKGPDAIAEEITKISDAARSLLGSKLSRRALALLIQDAISGKTIAVRDIDAVLDAAARLDRTFLR